MTGSELRSLHRLLGSARCQVEAVRTRAALEILDDAMATIAGSIEREDEQPLERRSSADASAAGDSLIASLRPTCACRPVTVAADGHGYACPSCGALMVTQHTKDAP